MLEVFESRIVDPALDNLDAVRASVLRRLGPLSRPFVRSRSLRVVVVTTFSVAFALAASVRATGYLLLLGPLLFGAARTGGSPRARDPTRVPCTRPVGGRALRRKLVMVALTAPGARGPFANR